MDKIITFFKEMGFYNEEYFRKIQNNTKIYNKPYEEIQDFIGCFPFYNEKKEIIGFRLILSPLCSIYNERIYIHEYTHALFLEDEGELFPSIMEVLYINRYVKNKKDKKTLLYFIEQQLQREGDENHKMVLR